MVYKILLALCLVSRPAFFCFFVEFFVFVFLFFLRMQPPFALPSSGGLRCSSEVTPATATEMGKLRQNFVLQSVSQSVSCELNTQASGPARG